MAITSGNWTVDVLYSDTISNPKSLSIPDLSYDTDYSVSSRKPTEVKLVNTTGSALFASEQLRYGRLPVDDIYRMNKMDIPVSHQAKFREGVQLVCETRYILHATNSVSGEELYYPIRGWLGLAVPTAPFITEAALLDLVKRTAATAFATAKTDASLITNVARGDLEPTA